MNSLAVLVLLVGVAVAAPQAAYKPSVKPVAAPYKAAAYPYAAPGYPYAAPGYNYAAPGYNYAAPGYPYAAPAYPYSAPAYYPYSSPAYQFGAPGYSKSPVYAAPVAKPASYVAPAGKPYAAPAPYNPQNPTPYVAIVRQSQDDNFDGSFSYDFQAENGIASQASGFVKNAGSEAEAQVIQGEYSYIAPDGTPIVTKYYADETGFHAEGDHLPVAPEAIVKSVAYQATLPAAAPANPAYYKSR